MIDVTGRLVGKRPYFAILTAEMQKSSLGLKISKYRNE